MKDEGIFGTFATWSHKVQEVLKSVLDFRRIAGVSQTLLNPA